MNRIKNIPRTGYLRDRRGVAALEFAIVLPLLVILLTGVYETTEYVRINSRLNHATQMLAKSVAQQIRTNLTPGQGGTLGDLCHGPVMEMSVFQNQKAADGFSASIESYSYRYQDNIAKVAGWDWNDSKPCGNAGPPLSADTQHTAASLSPNLGDVWIVVQSSFIWRPVIGFFPVGPIVMSSSAYYRPRSNFFIPCQTCATGLY